MNNVTMIEHHTEQMEAQRKEFNELWLGKIMMALEELGGVNNRVLAGVRHVCWMAYRAGTRGRGGKPAVFCNVVPQPQLTP